MHKLKSSVQEAFTTLFPAYCAGCGVADSALCKVCRSSLRALCRPSVSCLNGMLVASAASYEPLLRNVIVSYKEQFRVDTAKYLAPFLRTSLLALTRSLEPDEQDTSPLVLVTAPSRRAAHIARGFDHISMLLHHAVGTGGVRGLRHVRRVRDQSILSRDGRSQNISGAFRAAQELRGFSCVVVDDLLTTGATVSEAVRALNDVGARVLGAAVICTVESRKKDLGNK